MTITILGVTLILVLFIFITHATVKARKKAYVETLNKRSVVFLACAGSDEESSVSATTSIQAVETNAFKDKNGRFLNPADYRHFIVHGNSMKFCGINDKDLIFTDTNFQIENNESFPCVLVLRRNHTRTGKPIYKIRRTWIKTVYSTKENLTEKIKNLMASPSFQEIRQLEVYDGDEKMLADLMENRIPIYENTYIKNNSANPFDRNIIVSTTFHTKEGKIRFSIHPQSLIEGKVIVSFQI